MLPSERSKLFVAMAHLLSYSSLRELTCFFRFIQVERDGKAL